MASSDDDSGSASAEEVSDEAPGTYALTDHSPAAMEACAATVESTSENDCSDSV